MGKDVIEKSIHTINFIFIRLHVLGWTFGNILLFLTLQMYTMFLKTIAFPA